MCFVLDRRLAADTAAVGDLALCRVLLLNDARYPWVILVPRRAGITEIHRLDPPDRQALLDESCRLATCMEQLFSYDKLNVAALGNLVSQLHLHHVGRRVGDPAWPGPVWGHSPAAGYAQDALDARVRALRDALWSA